MARRLGQKIDPLSNQVFTREMYKPRPSAEQGTVGEGEGEGEEVEEDEDEEGGDEDGKNKQEIDEFEDDMVIITSCNEQ